MINPLFEILSYEFYSTLVKIISKVYEVLMKILTFCPNKKTLKFNKHFLAIITII